MATGTARVVGIVGYDSPMKRINRIAIAVSISVCVSVIPACSSQPSTFTVSSSVAGMVNDPSDITEGKSCKYMDATIQVGDPIILKGSDGRILSKATLTPGDMQYAVCDLDFKFENVPSDSGYTLELAPFPPVVATENELRGSFSLKPRNLYDVMWHRKGADQKLSIEVYDDSESSSPPSS